MKKINHFLAAGFIVGSVALNTFISPASANAINVSGGGNITQKFCDDDWYWAPTTTIRRTSSGVSRWWGKFNSCGAYLGGLWVRE